MRTLLRSLAAAALVLAALAGPARVHAADDDAPRPGACVCGTGTGACQHFLRNPAKPTIDPCWCPRCAGGNTHDGKSVPSGWDPTCFQGKTEADYLRRHCAAWGITCSECLEDDHVCSAGPAKCAICAANGPGAKDYAGNDKRRTVGQRLAKERRFFKKPEDVRILYDRHFYLVTDVGPQKVLVTPTTKRTVSAHEWAHLMLERAEYARREFTQALGDELSIDKPTGMYIPEKRRDGDGLAGTYLGQSTANILYGGTDKSTVADGFCFHGFVISMEQFGQGGDPAIHFAMRHMIGHELMSCWVVVDGHNRALPRWLHVGVAHWLSRLQPRFREDAFACNLEGQVLELPGTKWDKELRRIASTSKPGAIETLLAKSAQGQLSDDDHRRAWSWMDLCLSEWRDPWVALLKALRKRVPARDAFVQALGVTPEVFDERWRERVLGKRDSMNPEKKDDAAATAEALGARERAALRKETDPATLAALVRGLGTVADPETAVALVDLLERDDPLVRETVLVALVGIEDPATRDAAWHAGLAHKDPIARAYVARLCAARGITEALPELRTQLGDANWYARAEAARALGALHDESAVGALVPLVRDSADKTRVAAMDALADIGERAEPAVANIADLLTHSRWQLRVAAAQALGRIGSMEGVEPLLARMEVEQGRLRKDIQTALAAITHDDLGEKPEFWRDWWERQKVANGGRIPGRPTTAAPPAEPRENPDDRYAKPEYFGIDLFANRVAFVLDTSGSMDLRFVADAGGTKRRGRVLRGATKIEMCKSEIAESLKTLDPRSHFTLVSFSDGVKTWKDDPVVASAQNVESATDWLRNLPAAGETNYYDALRTVLDLGERPDSSPAFRDTPDTITFLTDGMPTRGALTDSKTLLSWFTNLNRYARVTTHVVAFGDKGLEVEFLRALAERNYGTFVHVHGRDG